LSRRRPGAWERFASLARCCVRGGALAARSVRSAQRPGCPGAASGLNKPIPPVVPNTKHPTNPTRTQQTTTDTGRREERGEYYSHAGQVCPWCSSFWANPAHRAIVRPSLMADEKTNEIVRDEYYDNGRKLNLVKFIALIVNSLSSINWLFQKIITLLVFRPISRVLSELYQLSSATGFFVC
jgi:hypothetical protein